MAKQKANEETAVVTGGGGGGIECAHYLVEQYGVLLRSGDYAQPGEVVAESDISAGMLDAYAAKRLLTMTRKPQQNLVTKSDDAPEPFTT